MVVENTFTAVQVGVSTSLGVAGRLWARDATGASHMCCCILLLSLQQSVYRWHGSGTPWSGLLTRASPADSGLPANRQTTARQPTHAVPTPPCPRHMAYPQDMVSKVVPPLKLLIGTGRPCNFLVTNKWPNIELIPRINKPLLMFVSVQVRRSVAVNPLLAHVGGIRIGEEPVSASHALSSDDASCYEPTGNDAPIPSAPMPPSS